MLSELADTDYFRILTAYSDASELGSLYLDIAQDASWRPKVWEQGLAPVTVLHVLTTTATDYLHSSY